MKQRHFNIPIFLPEISCNNKCIYCNQKKISGISKIPNPEQIDSFIQARLSILNSDNSKIQIAFFGGNFTGIETKTQIEYLKVAQKYIHSKEVDSIRISTRPDNISDNILSYLNDFNVQNIELGCQSMCDEVLVSSKRGHLRQDTINASSKIIEKGFKLGLQMMIGLPNDNKERAIFTAKEIVKLGAIETRIYPLIVFKETELFNLYKNGKYKPLSLDKTVDYLIPIVEIFEKAKINILRIGLHPSEEIISQNERIGPWHQSLKQMVYTKVWNKIINLELINHNNKNIKLSVSSKQYPNAIGYNKENKSAFFNKVNFEINKKLEGLSYYVNNS